MSPASHVWRLNGLDHHVLEWSEGQATDDTAVLVHGFQDAAATWDDVAAGLARAGFRVLVPDMRGFGDGPRVPPGAYYYFPDYVSDLAALVAAEVGRRSRLFVVGHSMGATVVTYFAGAFPERLTKLALIDGVGPPDNPADVAPDRMRRWIEGAYETTPANRTMTRAEGHRRLQRFNPQVDAAILARKLPQLSRPADGAGEGDDAIVWKGDPLHATTSPIPFHAEGYRAFARRVTCPVLHVSGGASGFHVPDEDERLASFPALSRVVLEGGHSLHWTMPAELTTALLAFWRR